MPLLLLYFLEEKGLRARNFGDNNDVVIRACFGRSSQQQQLTTAASCATHVRLVLLRLAQEHFGSDLINALFDNLQPWAVPTSCRQPMDGPDASRVEWNSGARQPDASGR